MEARIGQSLMDAGFTDIHLAHFRVLRFPPTRGRAARRPGATRRHDETGDELPAGATRGARLRAPQPRRRITASDAPVAAVAAAPAASAITYVIQTEDHTWLIAAMCLGTSAIWAGATLLLLRRRRALEMKPRAIDLIDRS